MRLTETPVWNLLKDHHERINRLHMRDLFEQDKKRFENYSLQIPHLFIDYSKNRMTQETLTLLLQLADTVQLKEKMEDLFLGKPVNITEHRSVLHTALRDNSSSAIIVNDVNVKLSIQDTLQKMRQFCESIHEKRWTGFTGKPMTDVVNIGIGGSDLGPKMVCQALSTYAVDDLRCHFVSNIDSTHIVETLKTLNPETTLFCIASKTFTTLETLTNARTAKKWLLESLHNQESIEKHFVAISANVKEAMSFGIASHNIFEFWDWIGGRYSVWSAIGLPIMLLIGADRFEEFLNGAYMVDCHFREAPFDQNAPVILALLDIWYRNFFHTNSWAIIPYNQYLQYFPDYLKQLNMESNGKSVDLEGEPLDYATAPVTWGGVGTDSQHSFHQLLHQGTDMIPIDFIVSLNSLNPIDHHHELLFTNCLAQSQALLWGKTVEEAYQELPGQGVSKEKACFLALHKMIQGNRPSNTLILEKLTPQTLGALIALYEHRIFVQGIIWHINSFDQWGVELGKQFAKKLMPDLEEKAHLQNYDASTRGLMSLYKRKDIKNEGKKP